MIDIQKLIACKIVSLTVYHAVQILNVTTKTQIFSFSIDSYQ